MPVKYAAADFKYAFSYTVTVSTVTDLREVNCEMRETVRENYIVIVLFNHRVTSA